MKLRRGGVTLVIFAAIYALVMMVMDSCMSFRMSSKEVDAYFESKGVAGTQHVYRSGFRTIHYVKSGDPGKPLVFFVHGSPGSLSAFIRYLADTTLLDKALLVSSDRPGFGYSNFGNAEASLAKQAEILKYILEEHADNRPIILVGHSLGGPLIAKMAIDYPNLVDGLVIVAGSIDPTLEPDEAWFRGPLATPFLSWLVPRAWRASNEEIYHLKPELEEMLPHWKEITCPVIVIQGTADDLVPKENADFAKQMLVNAQVEFVIVEGMNHFVPWQHPELIRAAVLKMINEIPGDSSDVRTVQQK